MIDTILFDLDGTLARFNQDEFISLYFKELSKVFIRLGLDAEKACKGVWAGTKAMVLNDGSVFNTVRFWDAFAEFVGIQGEQLRAAEEACDNFYTNEFNVIKSIVKQSDIPKRIVRTMVQRGYFVVLATNPLFPPCAVDSRLGWIGMNRDDFRFITHYENSTYCKPNPDYYNEVLTKIEQMRQNEQSPGIFRHLRNLKEQCLMVGNHPAEDMCAVKLGMEVFLVTDFMENETNIDISQFRHGTIGDLEKFLMALPEL